MGEFLVSGARMYMTVKIQARIFLQTAVHLQALCMSSGLVCGLYLCDDGLLLHLHSEVYFFSKFRRSLQSSKRKPYKTRPTVCLLVTQCHNLKRLSNFYETRYKSSLQKVAKKV